LVVYFEDDHIIPISGLNTYFDVFFFLDSIYIFR